jgi:hypothetical protein
MNRRSFLVCSTVSTVAYALPVGLSLITGQAFGAMVAQGVGEPLPALSSANEAPFRLHNWETDPDHPMPGEAASTFICLSASWKATWL